jgi:hypothetical protein
MSSKKRRTWDDAESVIVKKEVSAYKYSKRGQGILHEAIILVGEPCFVSWYGDNGPNTESIHIDPNIEEATRIIRPPNAEEYPYTPYEFADRAELNDYFSKANSIQSRAELYKIAKGYFKMYVDQDKNIIVILAADSILTYFQDLFPIIHYTECIGGNDVGKSSIGYTFSYTGYRVVRGTSISGANYTRILGSVEPGQCVIIEDEGDMISEDPVKVGILKAGYEYEMRIPKTNMNTKNQETNWFFPFSYKMVLAEKSLSEWKAKGLADRTFPLMCRPGRVRYSIKKVVSQTINKSPILQKLYDDILDFRKLMFCYRLIHYEDELPNIKTSLINRDEELTSPLLQLFYGTETFNEIKTALEYFIKQRRERRARSLAAAIYPILKKFVEISHIVESSSVWNEITSGAIRGTVNQRDPRQYDTEDYGSLYMNTLPKFIHDNFGCDLKHKEKGGVMIFDKEKFSSFDDIYNHESDDMDLKIDVSLVNEVYEDGHPEGSEGSEGILGCVSFDKNMHEEEPTHLQEPSVPSVPSASLEIPSKCYHCNFTMYDTKKDYESHCILKHAGKPAYPGSADFKASGLKPQGMSWEQ